MRDTLALLLAQGDAVSVALYSVDGNYNVPLAQVNAARLAWNPIRVVRRGYEGADEA